MCNVYMQQHLERIVNSEGKAIHFIWFVEMLYGTWNKLKCTAQSTTTQTYSFHFFFPFPYVFFVVARSLSSCERLVSEYELNSVCIQFQLPLRFHYSMLNCVCVCAKIRCIFYLHLKAIHNKFSEFSADIWITRYRLNVAWIAKRQTCAHFTKSSFG